MKLNAIEIARIEAAGWRGYGSSKNTKVNWRYIVEDVKIKLSHFYPTIEGVRDECEAGTIYSGIGGRRKSIDLVSRHKVRTKGVLGHEHRKFCSRTA